MQRLCLVLILIATTMFAISAEPVGADKRVPSPTKAPESSKSSAPPAARVNSVTAQSSLFSTTAMTALPSPGVLYPDLVPESTPFASVCTWNELAGETCESKCPPIVINLPFGTKNASNRALTSAGVVKVFNRNSGTFVGSYAFNGLPAGGTYKPASVKRLLVRCHPPGQVSVSPPPPPTHDVVVETTATEANKNNNSMPFHVGPNDQLVLP